LVEDLSFVGLRWGPFEGYASCRHL
jgi:hypothetical protein